MQHKRNVKKQGADLLILNKILSYLPVILWISYTLKFKNDIYKRPKNFYCCLDSLASSMVIEALLGNAMSIMCSVVCSI